MTVPAADSNDRRVDHARAQWRARRGLLELDVLLSRFLDERYARLSSTERQHLQRLLALADAELWSLVNGERQPSDRELAALVSAIRQPSCHTA